MPQLMDSPHLAKKLKAVKIALELETIPTNSLVGLSIHTALNIGSTDHKQILQTINSLKEVITDNRNRAIQLLGLNLVIDIEKY